MNVETDVMNKRKRSGFPAIAADLDTTVGHVSYSLASFFIGICVGQLICGPLLDRFGRKKPLYVGLVIYIVTCRSRLEKFRCSTTYYLNVAAIN